MDELLTPVTTTYLKPKKDHEPLFTEVKQTRHTVKVETKQAIASPNDVLDILKSQPDYESLIEVLHYLTNSQKSGFRLQVPSPQSAGIIQLLVAEIAPNYWTLLSEDTAGGGTEIGASPLREAELFLQCLRNVTGINALITQLRTLIQESQLSGKGARRPDIELNLGILLDILATVLRGDDTVHALWSTSTGELTDKMSIRGQSQQLVSVITNGRIVSVAAEASNIVGRDKLHVNTQWIADGLELSKWIGRNVASWARLSPTSDALRACYNLYQRGTSLGYSGMWIAGSISTKSSLF